MQLSFWYLKKKIVTDVYFAEFPETFVNEKFEKKYGLGDILFETSLFLRFFCFYSDLMMKFFWRGCTSLCIRGCRSTSNFRVSISKK